jgi:type I restriction enzyme S subunit
MRTDIKPVAQDWPLVRLGDVAMITLGGTPSTSVPSYWGGAVKWMASGNVNLKGIWDVEGRITESGLASSNATMVDPPSVAVGLAGQGKTRGTVAMVHVRLCTNQSIALIRGHDGVLSTPFLFHNLDARYEELRARSSGGGRGGLSRSILSEIPLAVPPYAEQSRVAGILDTIDEAIRGTQEVIAKLKLVKQGLLHDLLTRGIDESGELRPPPDHAPLLYKQSSIGWVPVLWQISSLGSVLKGIDAGKSPDLADIPARSGEWGVLKVSAVRPEGFEPSENKAVHDRWLINPELEVQHGDLLMSRANTSELVGMTCLVTRPPRGLLLCDKTLRLRIGPLADPGYVFWASQLDSVRRQVEIDATGTSGSMKNISQASICRLAFPLPPLNEQQAIVRAMAGLWSRVASELATLEKLQGMKKGLADDLLTGLARVSAREEVVA